MNEHEPKINRIMDSAEGVVTSQENSSKIVSSPIADNMEKQVDVEELKNKIKVFKEQLGKFIEKSPDSSRALRDENKIKLYKSIGKNEEAKKIQLEIARHEEAVGFDWLAAPLYEDAGEKEKAKECWEKRLVHGGVHNSPLHDELLDSAEIYEKLGDTKKSQEKYKEFIKLHENKDLKGYEYHMYKGLATAYEKLGDTETSKTMWEKVAENAWEDRPEDSGKAYDKAGDKEKAIEAYKKAIAYFEGIDRNGPHNNSYRTEGLVESYWALGEKSKAIELLKNRVQESEKYRMDDISYKKDNRYEDRHGKIEEGDGSDAVFNSYEDLEKYLNKYIAESSK